LRQLRACALDHIGQGLDVSAVQPVVQRSWFCEVSAAAGAGLQRVAGTAEIEEYPPLPGLSYIPRRLIILRSLLRCSACKIRGPKDLRIKPLFSAGSKRAPNVTLLDSMRGFLNASLKYPDLVVKELDI
jgi:hypothetical protein